MQDGSVTRAAGEADTSRRYQQNTLSTYQGFTFVFVVYLLID